MPLGTKALISTLKYTESRERGLPLTFLDAAYKPEAEFTFKVEMLAEAAKTSLGIALIGKELQQVGEAQKPTRRQFLKLMAGSATSAYL